MNTSSDSNALSFSWKRLGGLLLLFPVSPLLIATSRPSGSFPLYTTPKLPAPILFSREKQLVAATRSEKVNSAAVSVRLDDVPLFCRRINCEPWRLSVEDLEIGLFVPPLTITNPVVFNPQAKLPPAFISTIDSFLNSDSMIEALSLSSPQHITLFKFFTTPQENPNPDEIDTISDDPFEFGSPRPRQQITLCSDWLLTPQIWQTSEDPPERTPQRTLSPPAIESKETFVYTASGVFRRFSRQCISWNGVPADIPQTATVEPYMTASVAEEPPRACTADGG
nr:hypothetical protein D0Y65_036975 [Ipomoea batatas]